MGAALCSTLQAYSRKGPADGADAVRTGSRGRIGSDVLPDRLIDRLGVRLQHADDTLYIGHVALRLFISDRLRPLPGLELDMVIIKVALLPHLASSSTYSQYWAAACPQQARITFLCTK